MVNREKIHRSNHGLILWCVVYSRILLHCMSNYLTSEISTRTTGTINLQGSRRMTRKYSVWNFIKIDLELTEKSAKFIQPV